MDDTTNLPAPIGSGCCLVSTLASRRSPLSAVRRPAKPINNSPPRAQAPVNCKGISSGVPRMARGKDPRINLSEAENFVGVTSLVVSQADPHGEIQAGSGPAALRVSDSTSYVEVVPQRLGPITFTITAWFADGGLATSVMLAAPIGRLSE